MFLLLLNEENLSIEINVINKSEVVNIQYCNQYCIWVEAAYAVFLEVANIVRR